MWGLVLGGNSHDLSKAIMAHLGEKSEEFLEWATELATELQDVAMELQEQSENEFDAAAAAAAV